MRAATATETASSGSLLRPWPTDSTRTRAASLAGTSRTCSPSPTSRWASARPMPWAPSTAQQRCGQRPAHRRNGLVAVQGGGDALLVQQLAVLIQRGGGVGGLVGVDADHHRHAGTFLEGGQETPGGQADFGQGSPLLSHSRSGAGRTAQPFLSQPEERQRRLWSDLPAPWNPTAADPGLLPAFNKSAARR